MSIFEEGLWTKEQILNVFGSRKTLVDQSLLSRYTSNGEIEYNGCWFLYCELDQLIEILDEE